MILAIVAVALQPSRNAHGHAPPTQVIATPQRPAFHRPAVFSIRSPSSIAIENRRAGTRGWLLDRRAGRDVTGFAAPTSVPAGREVRLFVRTRASSVRADVYRIGWYAGAGARFVASLGAAAGDPQ